LFMLRQAGHGIRDATVTGVQTCALPISDSSSSSAAGALGSSVNRHSGMVPLSLAVALTAIVGAFAQKYAPILGTYVSFAETVTEARKSVAEGKSLELIGRTLLKKNRRRI